MSWILLSLLAPVVWALTNIIDKYVLSRLAKDPWLPNIAFGMTGAIAGVLIFLFKGFTPLNTSQIFLLLGVGIIYVIAEVCYYKAATLEEISRVISLIYLDPLFTAVLAALFLGELFSPIKYLGVVVLVGGAFLISYKFGQPFKIKKFFWLGVLSAFFFGICNLLSKATLGHADFWTVFSYIRFGSFMALLPVIFTKRVSLFNLAVKEFRNFSLITFNGALTLLGTFLFIAALSMGYATFTAALSALQPFFVLVMTVAIGTFYPKILKEEGGKTVFMQKLIAVILMFVGIILINPK